MSKHIKKIGIFDSGIGGLSILKPLLATFPAEYCYIADNAFMPYGNKSAAEIINRVQAIINYFEQQEVDLIIAACHTASAIALDEIQSHIPIISLVDQTLELLTPQESSALLATEKTIESGIYQAHTQNIYTSLHAIACPNLASAIEEHYGNNDEALQHAVQTAIQPITSLKPQNIILGCTHYAMVKHLIAQHIPNTPLVYADSLLSTIKKFGDAYYRAPQCTFIQTGNDPQFVGKVRKYINFKELENQKVIIRPRFTAQITL